MNLKNKVFSSLIWTTSGQLTMKFSQFIIAVLLARILTPEDFGTAAMALIINNIAINIIDGGFSHSIVQIKKIKPEALFSILLVNIIISIFISLIIFYTRFKIAAFFNIQILATLIPIMSISCLLSGIGAVPGALLTRDMRFKELTSINIIATIISGIIAIILARGGEGPWALIIQSLTFTFILTLGYWNSFNYKLNLTFSFKQVKEYSIFGRYILLSSALDSIFGRIYSIVIGKIYSVRELGLFNRADSTINFPNALLSFIINSVSFPLFCKVGEESEIKNNIYFQVLQMAFYVSMPLVSFLFIFSDPLILITYGKKWLSVSEYLKILVFIIVFRLPTMVNFSYVKSKGDSKSVFKTELIQKISSILSILLTFNISIKAIIYGQLITNIITFFISGYFVYKNSGIKTNKQLSKALKPFYATLILSIMLSSLSFIFPIINLSLLSLIVPTAIISYFFICKILKIESQRFLIDQILKKLN